MNEKQIIATLDLEPHPLEGGYFKRTYQSDTKFQSKGGEKHLLSSIYYMLTSDSPIGYMHKNKSDIIHYHHLGESTTYHLVSPDGEYSQRRLGPDIAAGDELQLLVPGGYWKASHLASGEYSLISEAVSPGFEYSDNELATAQGLSQAFPEVFEQIKCYIK